MRVLSLLSAIVFAAGCAPTAPKVSQPTLTTINLERPTVVLAPGYEHAKVIDGVAVTVTPTPFEEVEFVRRQVTEKQSIIVMNDMKNWEITDTPGFVFRPDNLQFAIKMTNNLGHVLRLAGIVVKVTADGQPLSASGLEEMERIVLVPGQSWAGTLQGPPTGAMPKNANLVFSIYDVVTAVDAANNATKRANFEWVFTYNTEATTKQAEIKKYEKKMTTIDAQAFSKGGTLLPAR